MSVLTRLLNSALSGRAKILAFHSAITCISNSADQPHFKSCPITFSLGAQFTQGLPWWFSGKDSACQCRRCKFNPQGVGKILWRRKWRSTSVLLPGESQEQRILAGYSPGVAESDMTEQLNNNNPYPSASLAGRGLQNTAQPISSLLSPPPSLSGWYIGFISHSHLLSLCCDWVNKKQFEIRRRMKAMFVGS